MDTPYSKYRYFELYGPGWRLRNYGDFTEEGDLRLADFSGRAYTFRVRVMDYPYYEMINFFLQESSRQQDNLAQCEIIPLPANVNPLEDAIRSIQDERMAY